MARTPRATGRYMTRRISKIDLHQLICAYPNKFRVGVSITNDWFCAKLGLITPDLSAMSTNRAIKEANAFNLTRMALYVRLNRQLALRGLVIRQRTNKTTSHTYYDVQPLEGAEERLAAYAERSTQALQQYNRLSTGIRRYSCAWTRLTDAELQRCY